MAYYRKLPSGNWHAEVTHPSGKTLHKTDPLKKVVKIWAEEQEASIRRGDWVDPKLAKVTVATWYEQCRKASLLEIATEKKNASAWNAHVEPKWGTWPLSSITYADCKEWVAELAKTKKQRPTAKEVARAAARKDKQDPTIGPDMVGVCGRLLRTLLDEAVKDKRLTANPMRLVKLPSAGKHEDRIILPAEELQLYAACDELYAASGEQVWPEYRAFLETLFGTGFRFQEAAGLLRPNVNPLKKTATVGQVLPRDTRELRRDAKSEAGTGRTVPLTTELAKILREHLGRHDADLVFVSAGERLPLNYNNVRRRQWARVLEVAKLAEPQPTMHDIRHTYGTRLADRQVPPHEIKELMGHARLASTERYLHAGEERMERARKALAGEQVSEESVRTPYAPKEKGRKGEVAGESEDTKKAL